MNSVKAIRMSRQFLGYMVECPCSWFRYQQHYLSVSIDDITYDEFLRLAEEYRAGHIDNNGDEITEPVEDDGGFFEFLGEHLVVVIVVAVIVVAAGGLITFVVIKKQRSRIV